MDFIKDNNPKILNFIKATCTVPSYVQFNSEVTKSASTNLYADMFANEFPIDTPSNTWLSYAYIKSASTLPFNHKEITNRLELAAAAHNIHEDIKKIDVELSSLEKSASTKKYAVYLDDNSTVKGYYPLNSRFEIEKSAAALVADYHKLPIEDFHFACVELVKAAAEQKMSMNYLHKQILEHGIEKEANFETAMLVAEQRASLIKDTEAKELYTGLVKFAAEEPHNTDQYIELFAELDRAYGVQYKYGTPDPYSAFYSAGLDKQAFEKCASENVVLAGIIIPYADIRNTNVAEFDNYLPKEEAELAKSAFTKSASSYDLSNAFAKLSKELQSEILGILVRT